MVFPSSQGGRRHARTERPQRGARQKFGSPTVTKDGVTVAKEIELEDPHENMGARWFAKSRARPATTRVTARPRRRFWLKPIYREGLKFVTAGANPIGIQRGIQKAVDSAVANLDKIAKKVKDKKRSNRWRPFPPTGTPPSARSLRTRWTRSARTAPSPWKKRSPSRRRLDVVEGMQFDKGYLSPHFVTSAESMECKLEDAYILNYEKKISSLKDLLPILEKVAKLGKPLLIIRRRSRRRSARDPSS